MSQVSTAAICWNLENGFCRSCMEYFNLRIAKYGWRNGCCENHSNIYVYHCVYTANEEAVLKSMLLVSLDNNSTVLFILDNSAPKIENCFWLVLLSVFPAFVHKKISMDKKWPSSFAGRVLTLSFVIPLPYKSWRRVFRSVAIFLFVFALFCFVIKSSMASRLSPMPDSVFTLDVSYSSG